MTSEHSGDPAGQHKRREQPDVCPSGRKAAPRRLSGKREKTGCERQTKTVYEGGGLREEAPGGDREETAEAAETCTNSEKKRRRRSSNTSMKEFNSLKSQKSISGTSLLLC